MLTAEPLSLSVTVELITCPARLDALSEDWRQLWRRCPEAQVKQQPESALRRNRQDASADLHVLALFNEERLVGLVPLRLVNTDAGRTLELLRNEQNDTLEAMIEPGFERAATVAIFDFLVQHATAWDACDFAQLCPGSVLLSPEVPLSWSDRIEESDRGADARVRYRRVLRRAA